MKIINSPKILQKTIRNLKKRGSTIALVPTMGALHEGHLSLVQRAKKENDIVIVSIFVNPAQFGPNEDYLRYPRPFKKDVAMCRGAGVDYIFAPTPKEMYPDGYLTYVQVEKMSEIMCGKFRPGHFRGVATVVAKLFNICLPDKAYFGLKDYQQLKIIEKMVKDLNIPVKIVPCPIVREKTGLALSSRNQYLSHDERCESLQISAVLKEVLPMIKSGRMKSAALVISYIKKKIHNINNSKIDYIVVADPITLEPLKTVKNSFVIAVAVWVGNTRLIDNVAVNAKKNI